MDKVTQADEVLAEEIASAANIVSHDGYYEIDIAAVAQVLARHRLAALAEPRSDWRGIESAPKDGTKFVGWGKPSGLSPEGAYVTRWKAYGKGSPAHAAWERGDGPEGTFWHDEPVSNWTNGWTPRLWSALPPEPAAEASDNKENTRG